MANIKKIIKEAYYDNDFRNMLLRKKKIYKSLPGNNFEYLNSIIDELFKLKNDKFIKKYEDTISKMTDNECIPIIPLIFCIHDLKHYPINRDIRIKLNDVITNAKTESFWEGKEEDRKTQLKEVCDYIGDCEIRLI